MASWCVLHSQSVLFLSTQSCELAGHGWSSTCKHCCWGSDHSVECRFILFALVLLQAAMKCSYGFMQVFTSDHALKLDWIPKWIAIIGSGYIGLEFSDVYTALGSEVTFIEAGSPIWCIRQPYCCQADNQIKLHGKLCSNLYVLSAFWCRQCTLLS